jgi:hypothetical protein
MLLHRLGCSRPAPIRTIYNRISLISDVYRHHQQQTWAQTMFFIYTPQNPAPIYYDPEEAFLEYKRREYVKRLQEQHRRALFERELQLEKERHEAALVEIARKEAARRQRMAQLGAEAKAQAASRHQQRQRYAYQPQDVSYQQEQVRPTPREILARRLARQKEEEQRSRQFHQDILSHIFGVPPEEFDESMEDDDEEEEAEEPHAPGSVRDLCDAVSMYMELIPYSQSVRQPTLAQLVNEFSKRQNLPEQAPPVRKPSLVETTEASSTPVREVPTEAKPESAPGEPVTKSETDKPETDAESHWSAAPERARSLAEISSINRSFNALKSTFVFPSGTLQRLPDSDTPRLAFNSTNATIHAYEHALGDLLSKLDGIESYGFKGVREARKQMVVKIEQELEDLDKKIVEHLTEGGTATSVSIPIETPEATEVEMKDEAKEESHVSEMSSETPGLPSGVSAHPAESETNETMNVSAPPSAVTPPLPAEPVKAMTISTPLLASDAGNLDASHSKTEGTSDPAKVDNAKASVPSVMTPAELVPLPETASDEDLEVADAIHIDVTDDESNLAKGAKEHKSAVGEFEML